MPAVSGSPGMLHAEREVAVRRRALSKVAWRFLPLLTIAYIFNYLDRTSVGFAALTMNRDIGLTAYQFGWGAGLLFASYSVFEIPSNLILYRFGARRWIARIMITWGSSLQRTPSSSDQTVSTSFACCWVPPKPGFFQASRFSSLPGFRRSTAPACWRGSWLRFRYHRYLAVRCPGYCCRWTDWRAWPGGNGCSSSRACPPASSALSFS
jgi:hypothetical protein